MQACTTMSATVDNGDSGEDKTIQVEAPQVSKKEPDYERLRPLFGWLPTDTIKNTFQHTTQYGHLPVGTLLKRRYKSPNPALNVYCRNESLACDVVYSNTPAVDNGSKLAVIFVGLDTQVTDIYGIKSDKQFVNTLEDNIRERGAPNKLISDRGSVEVSNRVLDILRALCISDWQSEPKMQHQNHSERRYQTIKTAANRVMDRTGAPPSTWLLCLMYVCYLLNHTYNDNIKNVPLTALTGETVDTSVLLQFSFWQKVYYRQFGTGFPSASREAVGHIVGISEHVGHALTWKILTADTNKIIYRSLVRPCTDEDPNLRAELACGETLDDDDGGDTEDNDQDPHLFKKGVPQVIRSRIDDEPSQVTSPIGPAPVFNPEDLVGRTFLMDHQDDGQRRRARIVQLLEDHESEVERNPTRIKFLLSVGEEEGEEVMTYNDLLGYLARDDESDIVWKFRRIISHQGPLRPDHKDHNGSTYNVMVEWETGEVTSKEKKLTRMVNQAKLRSYNTAPRYKYGFEVPKNYAHALRLDERNGNTLWKDAVATERNQIQEYDVFDDHGHNTKVPPPTGYKKIRIHLVFDVKHDGRHKARLVADGHLTDIPIESVYSGVVSLRGFRLVVFLAELNSLPLWATDIGNAYLEARTSELVYIIAGPEFEELEGHILVIVKALYGLRSSGARWHERLADCLRGMGFFPCKAEPDIWMRKAGNIYEYVAVYVDDLAMALVDPQAFVDILEKQHKFKLKGTGPISFHLGMDFTRDEDGTLCLSPTKYIEKMVANYEKVFGEKPKHIYHSPLEKGDHPELDTTEILDGKGIEMYQSLIGSLQWIISIGRLDVQTAVMTLSGFRVAPKVGHLDRAKRIYGYLSNMRHGKLRIRTEEPDYSDIPDPEHDWAKTVYGDATEVKPHDAPEPLGRFVTLTHYVDANLMHDVSTGRSVTGILTLINKTPLDWYSKKQATVETATYGSEFVAARTCVEQIIELRSTLRYLGVPLRDKSYMFGDNKSVVDSGSNIDAKLHKRHTMLSFHRVREAIAAGFVTFLHISGEINPADMLSKHWGYAQIWERLKAIMFWRGDTAEVGEHPSSNEWGVSNM
jgi:Reverse transcriptase (RNA-dependent DNA polymerase)